MDLQLVITIDGLNARCLGPYGNHWIPTPSLNQLAANGTVFDFFIAESDDCQANLSAMVDGEHPLLTAGQSNKPVDAILSQKWDLLVTEDGNIAENISGQFHAVESVDVSNPEFRDHPFETLLGFAYARLESLLSGDDSQPLKVWIHSRGLFNPWRAPLETQTWFKDESDPEPVGFEDVPAVMLAEDFDPDERLVYLHAYAAEVVELDKCLGRFVETILDVNETTTFVIAGVRGLALGEHLEIGHCGKTFHSEKLQIPLIVSAPGQYPSRCRTMIGSHEFSNCIDSRSSVAEAPADNRSLVVSAGSGYGRIQTRAWSYVHPLEDGQLAKEANGQLFSKPDDALEINEVAEICPEIAAALKHELESRISAYAAGAEPDRPVDNSLIFDSVS